MLDEIVTLVDLDDQVVGKAPRSRVREEGLIHRVTYILVFNTVGQLLLQKRTSIKDLFPSYYDAAAGGVVQYGESYEVSAIRELGEELGARDTLLTFQFDHYFDDGFNRYWGRVFSCRYEGPFKLQVSEVESVLFVDVEQILSKKINPLTPDTFEVLRKFKNK